MRSVSVWLSLIIISAGICLLLALIIPSAMGSANGKEDPAPQFPPEFQGMRSTEDKYPYVVEIRDYDHPIQPEEMTSWKDAVIAAYQERVRPREFRETVSTKPILHEGDIIMAYGYFITRTGVPHEMVNVAVKCPTCTGEDRAVTRSMIRWFDTDLGPFITNTSPVETG